MKKPSNKIRKSKQPARGTVEQFEGAIDEMVETTDAMIDPVRKSVAKRYPTLFLLAVTFGVATTFAGFDRILQEFTYLTDRPILMLLAGLGILIATGTLYRKLG